MTKGIDTQTLRQKFSYPCLAVNWYKWLQMSWEAERVLSTWHRDLRDSCKSFLHHCCWQGALTWPGSASAPASHWQHCCPALSAPLPLSPKRCCRRAAHRHGPRPKKPQSITLLYHHISELTVWLLMADGRTLVAYLVLSEGQIYFLSLCLSFLPAEAARQSVHLWYFFFQAQLCCS